MYATALQALWTVVPLLAATANAATPLSFEPAGDAGISAQMVSSQPFLASQPPDPRGPISKTPRPHGL